MARLSCRGLPARPRSRPRTNIRRFRGWSQATGPMLLRSFAALLPSGGAISASSTSTTYGQETSRWRAQSTVRALEWGRHPPPSPAAEGVGNQYRQRWRVCSTRKSVSFSVLCRKPILRRSSALPRTDACWGAAMRGFWSTPPPWSPLHATNSWPTSLPSSSAPFGCAATSSTSREWKARRSASSMCWPPSRCPTSGTACCRT
mmetsp:Transcript_46054/g.108045  ORF Transcript_46054/g.108045 Transcript_46054/m.108045 type:complete len:203 (+) Transcript_46054:583-1191(+)